MALTTRSSYVPNNALLNKLALRSDRLEPHQEHRIGTVSDNWRGGGGFNRFYGIPTIALCPGTVHKRCFRL